MSQLVIRKQVEQKTRRSEITIRRATFRTLDDFQCFMVLVAFSPFASLKVQTQKNASQHNGASHGK